jgi:predicted ArsR family transcriptional regulator
MNPPKTTCRQDEVLRTIKGVGPLHVRDVAARLECSYMGAKEHCLALEARGLLLSRNVHRGKGRPLLVYSLTRRGQAWFEDDDNAAAIAVLRHAQNLFGAATAGKLLFLYFQERGEKYRSQIPAGAGLAEKLEAFAKVRDAEGCMAECDPGTAVVERHSPWRTLHKAFPECDGLEEGMVRQVLGVPVRRKFVEIGAQYEVRFELHTPVSQR